LKKANILGLCAGASLFCMTPLTAFAATPSSQVSQKAISVNQQTVSKPYGSVHDGTTYMPIWYLMNALNKLGVQATWDGNALHLTASSGSAPNLSNVDPGTGSMAIYLDGKLVQRVNGTAESDPASNGTTTTYMPIWYLMQALNRMHVNTDWSGFDLDLSKGNASASGSYSVVTNTESTRSRTDSSTSSSSSSTSVSGQDIVDYAKQYIGVPYAYGGESTSGMDCSGLTQTVYRHFSISLPRTAAEQAQVGQIVSKSDLQPGDLVFFNTTGSTYSHVGIYVGSGQFISATTSKGVRICSVSDPYYWGAKFTRATNPQG
jgi:cell wall-associated NlpC family hydrolase